LYRLDGHPGGIHSRPELYEKRLQFVELGVLAVGHRVPADARTAGGQSSDAVRPDEWSVTTPFTSSLEKSDDVVTKLMRLMVARAGSGC
jgi:hypothetical protein